MRHGANAIGLVAEMPSGPGTLKDPQIRDIARSVPPGVDTFLLTSRTQASDIADHIRYCGTNTVQIVTHIEPGELEALARALPATRRVQVIHVEAREALDLIPAYEPFVHAFLLDSGRPNQATPEYGGTGRTHDWSISREFVNRSSKPVFLAGGLSAHNVAQAYQHVHPWGLDLCSGVRTRGALDEEKLTAYMRAITSATA